MHSHHLCSGIFDVISENSGKRKYLTMFRCPAIFAVNLAVALQESIAGMHCLSISVLEHLQGYQMSFKILE
jgi:hypothetical protein